MTPHITAQQLGIGSREQLIILSGIQALFFTSLLIVTLIVNHLKTKKQ